MGVVGSLRVGVGVGDLREEMMVTMVQDYIDSTPRIRR
jgi:hypothetical protein